jgi:hypothetical protein
MKIFVWTMGSIIVLAILCMGGILLSSNASEDDFEKWFEETFGKSFEETFKEAWDQSFEQTWEKAFADDPDDELKKRFRAAFSDSFRDSFREAFDETWRKSFEHTEKVVEADEDGEVFRDGDEIVWKDELTFDESAEGLNSLELKTINGSVKITGSDTDTVHIVAFRTVRSIDKEGGEAYREKFCPVVQRKGDMLVVDTYRPEKNKSKPRYIKGSQMSYEVSLPARFEMRVETVNGSVKVNEVQGRASLHTVNGSVELTASEGGEVKAETVNGKISVRSPRLMSKSDIETVNGSIEVKVEDALEGELRAKTVNGSIKLKVPGDASFHLRAETAMSGSIHTDWGKPDRSHKRFGKSYEIDVNGGGKSVKLGTTNGSIRVERID